MQRDDPAFREGVGFVLRLAKALHTHGAPAHRLEEALAMMAAELKVEGHFLSAPTSLTVAFGEPPDQTLYLLRVDPGAMNLGVLADLDEVLAEFTAHRLTPAQGQARLDRILEPHARYAPWLTTLCFGVTAACTARFFEGGWREVLTAGAIGIQTGLLLWALRRRPAAMQLFEPGAATLASLTACAVTVRWAHASPYIASVAGLIVLLPGLTLTTALTELGTRNLVSGTARLSGALLAFLGIGAGLALGAGIATRIWGSIPQPAPTPLATWTQFIALAIAPFAMTVLFRARWREAGWIFGACVLAFGCARVATRLLGPELGTFAAAAVSAGAGNLYSRMFNRSAAVLQVPAILFLIPGSLGVRSVSSLIANDVVGGLGFAVSLGLTAVGLAAGILLANVVLTPRRPL